MTSPTGDATAAHLTARDFESWNSDIFGSPAHPLIGPTGAPGYWDRASIAAAPTSPDSLRNCTFVTLNPTHDTAIYYGPTCPPAPRNPFADPGFWFGLLASFVVCGLFLGAFVIKDKMDTEPHVTWSGWAWRAWVAVVNWPRRAWAAVFMNEYVRTLDNGHVRWIAAGALATTETDEGLGEQRGKVQWWRWTESSESGSGYMLVDATGAPLPAALTPPEHEEPDEDGAPPPYSTKTGSPARWP
ncbi:hypothetical protein AMAG_15894 [Allomyces macrogynus ATCC 38327]|uniref:Uncharacterized protein n=1 Tax=Allomyces macrogynus (strain ATCC 38327) TaxID=578462 RepID=A0A0L0T9K2_ALLM3|nr:hypothetical protein AMAG_15894 [Allomyces macrogynus ATCC 38327]|eukprot:KNE71239.1 hypothetical protein AMAG_15894 [Allomyces macrogynus ATCC 38327]